MSDDRPRIGVSQCLLGESVRYDGGHKHARYVTDVLGAHVALTSVCPEVEAGMGIPREPVRLVKDGEQVRMVGTKGGQDWTGRMKKVVRARVKALEHLGLSGFVLKKGSPSCGMARVKLYNDGPMPDYDGVGLFARHLMEKMPLLPVEEEGRLNDPFLREQFVERVFAHHRWLQLNAERRTRARLTAFHARHKYLVMAHDEPGMRALGRLVAGAKGRPIAEVYGEYGEGFMAAMKKKATVKKHTNVLQHLQGHVSDALTPAARVDLVEVIDRYRKGRLPLSVPVTLLRHLVTVHEVAWAVDQVYLDPHPDELMLRNHA